MTLSFEVTPAAEPRTEPIASEQARTGFGSVFTDHMVTIAWSAERGWHDPQVRPYGPLTLSPAAQVLHYGQEVFEGLKAYRHPDGSIHLFRPDANARRLRTSCQRMCMPELEEAAFVRAVSRLVEIDHNWVPSGEGTSLYLRPFMIATQPSLGFRQPAQDYLFAVIGSPAASYFGGDGKTLTVWLEDEFTRVALGGTGEAKCGGNYAGTLLAQQRALARGCDQVIWLDAVERRWIDEMGTSNVFFVLNGRLVTPPLSGGVLPGITRDSVLQLGRELGYEVAEEPVAMDDLLEALQTSQATEAFSVGTTSMISAIGTIMASSGSYTVGDGREGPVSEACRRSLTDIQYGRAADRHGWTLSVL